MTAIVTAALAFGAFALRDTAEPVALGTVREEALVEPGVIDLGDIDELTAAQPSGSEAEATSASFVGPPAWAAGEQPRQSAGDPAPGSTRLRASSPWAPPSDGSHYIEGQR